MKVAIIGSGTMGSGIALVIATAGYKVKVVDSNQDTLIKSAKNLENTLSKLVEKNKIDETEKTRIINNFSYVSSVKELADADFVIEAIVENIEIKKKLFAELESIVSSKAILASNTSSLSITSIASACKNPERVIGIHFFNPAPIMALVEVIPAIQTSKLVLEKVVKTISNWKKVVAVAKDTPGFIVNRVARPFYSEALRIYDEGIADFATIDWAMKSLGNFKMGPFELMDFIGNDVNYAVTESIFTSFYFDTRYKPSFTQKRLSEAGFFGRKSGRGYYNYADGATMPKALENAKIAKYIFERILVMLINEAADALFFGIATAKDIDNAMIKGVNYPNGLLAWADEMGINWCVNKLDELYNEYHEDRYRCCVLLRKLNRENKNFYSN